MKRPAMDIAESSQRHVFTGLRKTFMAGKRKVLGFSRCLLGGIRFLYVFEIADGRHQSALKCTVSTLSGFSQACCSCSVRSLGRPGRNSGGSDLLREDGLRVTDVPIRGGDDVEESSTLQLDVSKEFRCKRSKN